MKNHQKTWNNYHKFADQRGELVVKIITQFTEIKNKNILDIGCADGGTALKFALFGANVTAIDIRSGLSGKFKNTNVQFHQGSFDNFAFEKKKFDIIILQDVLEHVPNPESAIKKIFSLLSKAGIIYVSTPNRFSLVNVISDPHWGLPFLSLFSRSWVKLFVSDTLRVDRRQREDWAALLSLLKLKKIMNANQLEINFVNSFMARYLFEKPQAIVCKPSHIKLINWMNQNGFHRWIRAVVNDKFGFFNYFINPTWYIVLLHNRQKNIVFKKRALER